MISRGRKIARLDMKESHTLPKLIRKKPLKQLYEEYKRHCEAKPGTPQTISDTSPQKRAWNSDIML